MTAVALTHDSSPPATPTGILRIGLVLFGPILRVPLLAKVLGANLIVVLAALLFLVPGAPFALRMAIVLLLSFGVTALLVWLALRPIEQLESTAGRVSDGDFDARAPVSLLADRDIARLSVTLNRLLDRVQADRARIQYLAGRSVRARDIERECVARELRDSLAQMVSAIALQLAAVRLANGDPTVDQQLEATRRLIEDLTDQMRGVADTLYPGTLGEFGLLNGLHTLGRLMARRSPVTIEVDAGPFTTPLSSSAAGALYRVADEALRNVVQHAQAHHARVLLRAENGVARLEIEDDGRGVDVQTGDPLQAGLGLFSAKAVLALAGGELQISGAPGQGTRVMAWVPTETSKARTWRATSSE